VDESRNNPPLALNDLPKTFYGTLTKQLSLRYPAIDGSHPIPIKCIQSNYLTWRELPDENYLSDYYSTTYYENNKDWYNVENDYTISPIKEQTIRRIKKAADVFLLANDGDSEKPLKERYGSIIVHDIGCSFGGLVSLLRRDGFQAHGTDLNVTAINEGRKHGNLYIQNLSLVEFLQQNRICPDVFVSNHALEHFIDPPSFMKDLYELFGDNSLGCFTWPNGNSYPALVGNYDLHGWYAYPDHLHLFGPYASFRLLMDAGFAVLSAESASYGDFNIENIKYCLSPLNPNAIIDYDPFRIALEKNFAGVELCFVFCKKDSKIAQRNKVAIEQSLILYERLESAGV
jgi:2-polyprenyl-3-methyl-5-hydroxy-6-metoxy-1,4-benzoquinol methylase